MTGPRIKLVKHPSTGNVEMEICESIFMDRNSLFMIPSDGWKIEDPFGEYKDKIKELKKRLAYAEKAKEWVLKNLRDAKNIHGYWYDEPGSKDVFNREYLCELPDGWLLDDAIEEVTKEELYPKKEE